MKGKLSVIIVCIYHLLSVSIAIGQAETQNNNSAAGLFWRVKGNTGTTSPTSAIGTAVNNNFIGTTNTQDFVIASNNLEKMRFSSNYYMIGIGQQNPQFAIDVTVNPDAVFPCNFNGIRFNHPTFSNACGNGLFLGIDNSALPTGEVGALYNFRNTGRIQFGIGTTEKMRLVSNGLGINVTSPLTQLHITENTGLRNGLMVSQPTSPNNDGVLFGLDVTSVGVRDAMVWNYISNGDLKFGTQNTERVRIDLNGRVGIATANPQRLLHVSGLTSGVRLEGLASGGSFVTSPTSPTDKLVYADASGDIPAIAGGSTGQILTLTGTGPAWVNATGGAWSITGNAGTNSGTNFIGTTDNVSWRVRTNNLERMVVDSTGNVGIGTSTPAYKLDILAPGGVLGLRILSGNAAQPAYLSLGRTAEYAQIGACTTGSFFTDALPGDMAIKNFNSGKILMGASVSSASYLAITTTGDIGIGTSSPFRRLQINGTTSGFRYGGVATGGSFITATSATTDKILYADANGDVRAMTTGTTGDVLTYTATGPAWAASAGGSSGWNLTGNTGTNATTNYLGTTDATDLVFRTNATARMRVMGNANQVVINSATPAAASVLSVYSTTTDDAAVLTSSGGGRGLLVSTSLTGIGIGVAKTGTTGRGIELTMALGTSNEGIFVSHAGSGRAASFNGAGTGQTVFMSNTANNRVLQAQNTNAANTFPVIQASQSSTQTNTNAAAVYATSTSSTGGYFTASKSDNLTIALRGVALSTGAFDPIGVYGEASTTDPGFGYGLVGTGNNFAVYGNGDYGGTGLKYFVIDHPLYPDTKFLKHYSAEANEPLNFYRGNVVADANGEAVVQLPEYFHAVNINFSYVLTPIGAPASVFVKSEVNKSGQFEIAGAKPGMKVSWYVYAQRNDPYVQQHPEKLKAEFDKKPHEAGKYYLPELYGQPKEKGIFYRQAPTVNTIDKE